MLRGIIRGHIVSTKKQESLVGSKFMEVELMKNGQLTGEFIIAVDSVGAGIIGMAKCMNPKCVTNHQPIKTRFTTIAKGDEISLLCHFCEKVSDTRGIF